MPKLRCSHKFVYILLDKAVCLHCDNELELTQKYERNLSAAYKRGDKYLPLYRLRGGRK